MLRLAHLVNVVELGSGPHPAYLHVAQPVTLQSMVNARQMAAGAVQIDLLAVRHERETAALPAGFRDIPCVRRYCWEVHPQLLEATEQRPLPLLADLLRGFDEAPATDYCLFTNVDIGLQPNFYLEAKQRIESGLDAFCINRRNLPKEVYGIRLDVNHLPLIYALEGQQAGGTDCFVFRSSLLPQLRLGGIFTGYPPVGRVLRRQIEARAKRFDWFKQDRLTFHLGDDRIWLDEDSPYARVNLREEERLAGEETPSGTEA
jgi:hypothetical protein